MNKVRLVVAALLVMVFGLGNLLAAEGQKGTLQILGVPSDTSAGRYEPQEGIFFADVVGLEGALIEVNFEEVQILGQKMEWKTKDNHLIFEEQARLEKTDFELTAAMIEYFGDEKRLLAAGDVLVVTEDATVYADHLAYDENTDEALFTGKVRVVFEDGVMEGEKFLMFLERSELQFFGSFQGEFNAASEQAD